jgi:hypothetical protein
LVESEILPGGREDRFTKGLKPGRDVEGERGGEVSGQPPGPLVKRVEGDEPIFMDQGAFIPVSPLLEMTGDLFSGQGLVVDRETINNSIPGLSAPGRIAEDELARTCGPLLRVEVKIRE